MAAITESELLRALQEALEKGQESEGADGAMTVSELSDSLGWYREKVRKVLRVLKREGRLETLKVHRMALDGGNRVSPAYRYVPEEEG